MGVYELYEDIYKLKNLLRSGWTKRHAHSKLGRVESDAEHTFSMAPPGRPKGWGSPPAFQTQ